jgi:hypothetical protein
VGDHAFERAVAFLQSADDALVAEDRDDRPVGVAVAGSVVRDRAVAELEQPRDEAGVPGRAGAPAVHEQDRAAAVAPRVADGALDDLDPRGLVNLAFGVADLAADERAAPQAEREAPGQSG